MTTTILAIKHGRWVEFRQGKIKKVISKVSRTIETSVEKYVPSEDDFGWGRYVYEPVSKNVSIKQTSYVGGKLLGKCAPPEFKNFYGTSAYLALTKAKHLKLNGSWPKILRKPK